MPLPLTPVTEQPTLVKSLAVSPVTALLNTAVYVIVVALLGEVVVVVSEVNVGIDESVVTVAMLEAFAGPVLPAWSVTVFAKIQMLMTPWLHPVSVTEKVVENPELGVVE